MKNLMLALLFLLAINGIAYGQDAPPVARVNYPVSGDLLLGVDNRILEVRADTGQIETIFELPLYEEVRYARWDNLRERIVYNNPVNTEILNVTSSPLSVSSLLIADLDTGLFLPQSWSRDSRRILGIVTGSNLDFDALQLVDVSTGIRTVVQQYRIGAPFPDNTTYEVTGIRTAALNPVFDDWIMYEIHTVPEGSQGDPDVRGKAFIVVENYATGEKHILNEFLSAAPFWTTSQAWSPDGTKLAIETDTLASRLETINVLNPDGRWQVATSNSAPDLPESEFVSWLGVGNLLLIEQRTTSPVTVRYMIAEVSDGELVVIDFLQVPLSELTSSFRGLIADGSWHLRADETERATLSCLFDRALAAQIAVGDVAQVVADDRPLREAPSVDAAEVTRVPQGTAVDVTGGPYCADGMRWWQIVLEDSITGWLAEADGASYWLEG